MLDGQIKDRHRMYSSKKIVIKVMGMLVRTYEIAVFNKHALCLGMGLLGEAFFSLHRFYGFLFRKDLFMKRLFLILTLLIDFGPLVFCLDELIDEP